MSSSRERLPGGSRPSPVKRLAAISFVLVALLGACAKGTAGGATDSGIHGIVLLGPTCPVEQANSPCPDKPMQTEVRVLDEQGTEVAKAHSGADGRFTVPLDPGKYTLVAVLPAGGGSQSAQPVAVTVIPHAFADAKVLVDSGIR